MNVGVRFIEPEKNPNGRDKSRPYKERAEINSAPTRFEIIRYHRLSQPVIIPLLAGRQLVLPG